MAENKVRVWHFEPGKAVAVRYSGKNEITEDDVKIGLEEWPIEFVAAVPGVFGDDNVLTAMASDNGNVFKLIIGSYVDGKKVDLMGDFVSELNNLTEVQDND